MTDYVDLHVRALAIYSKLKELPYSEAIAQINDAEYVQECVRAKIDALHRTKSEAPTYIRIRFVSETTATSIETGGGGIGRGDD